MILQILLLIWLVGIPVAYVILSVCSRTALRPKYDEHIKIASLFWPIDLLAYIVNSVVDWFFKVLEILIDWGVKQWKR